jgi:Ca2+-binding RTX toxin-like protein
MVSKVMVAAVMALIASAAKEARAATIYTGTYADSSVPVSVLIGNVPSMGGTYMAYLTEVGGCHHFVALDSSTLSQNWTLWVNNPSGFVEILSSSYSNYDPFSCGSPAMAALNYGGYYFDIHGGNGNDALFEDNPAGDTYMYGGSGNDWLEDHDVTASVYGQDGNDIIWMDNASNVAYFDAGNGDDCLHITPGASSNRSTILSRSHCGSGSDKFSTAFGGVSLPPDGSCEAFTTCP